MISKFIGKFLHNFANSRGTITERIKLDFTIPNF